MLTITTDRLQIQRGSTAIRRHILAYDMIIKKICTKTHTCFERCYVHINILYGIVKYWYRLYQYFTLELH